MNNCLIKGKKPGFYLVPTECRPAWATQRDAMLKIKKIQSTPKNYPRAYATILKKTLKKA